MRKAIVVVVGLLLHAAQGAPSVPGNRPLSYDWQPIAAPVTSPARIDHGCAWDPVNDMLYMYGGCPSFGGTPLALCQRYDPSRDTWTDLAPMSIPRYSLKGIYCRGRLFAFGGCPSTGTPTESCEAYDIATNTWSQIAALPTANAGYQAVVWRDSLIYVMGSMYDVNGLQKVYIYNPFSNTWTTGTPMLTACGNGDACVIGDTIYFAGGYNRNTHNYDSIMRVGAIDPAAPEQISWSWGAEMATPRSDGPTIALDGKVYWFGGNDAYIPSEPSYVGRVYDPATGQIDWLPRYPCPVRTRCLGVARESRLELYGFAGRGSNADTVGYYRLSLPGYHDAGAVRVISPRGDLTSGDTVALTAVVRNHGITPASFRIRFRIDGGTLVRYESTSVAPKDSLVVSFGTWIAAVHGPHITQCSTLLEGDDRPANDPISASFTVDGFDAGISGLQLPETLTAGPFTPVALVTNYGGLPGSVQMYWRFLRDDTLVVYAECESLGLDSGAHRRVTFPSWNATEGRYGSKCFLVRNNRLVRDTVQRYILVVAAGIGEGVLLAAGRFPRTATVARDVILLPAGRSSVGVSAVLLDVSGSEVLKLSQGPNDVSRLSPGVYFVRAVGCRLSAVSNSKVVLTR